MLREKIGLVNAVVYTHEHADHVFGLDDVRLFPYYLGHKLPLYCEKTVDERIRKSFDYAFAQEGANHAGASRCWRCIQSRPSRSTSWAARITPIRLLHGRWEVLGFRFGNIAYCTDTNKIPEESWPLLEGLDVLVLDALRPKPHATHFGLDEAIAVAEKLAPRRTLFTHLSHELEHQATSAILPPGMELAYDGLRIPLT